MNELASTLDDHVSDLSSILIDASKEGDEDNLSSISALTKAIEVLREAKDDLITSQSKIDELKETLEISQGDLESIKSDLRSNVPSGVDTEIIISLTDSTISSLASNIHEASKDISVSLDTLNELTSSQTNAATEASQVQATLVEVLDSLKTNDETQNVITQVEAAQDALTSSTNELVESISEWIDFKNQLVSISSKLDEANDDVSVPSENRLKFHQDVQDQMLAINQASTKIESVSFFIIISFLCKGFTFISLSFFF